MSFTCTYDTVCTDERALDFEMCPRHLNTPRGRQHVLDVIAVGNLTLPSQVRSAVQAAAELPEHDIQTHVLEKMSV